MRRELKIVMDETELYRLLRLIESEYTHYGYSVWEVEE